MSDTHPPDGDQVDDEMFVDEPAPAGTPTRLVVALLAVIAVALTGIGFALGVITRGGNAEAAQAPVAPADDSVDVGFCRDMMTHHQQAVEMAGLVRGRSTDPAIRTLAFDIETAQINQVGQMQGFLRIWGRNQNSRGDQVMSWIPDGAIPGHVHGTGEDGALMPGMATSQEMAELESASGTDLDVLFLRLMIRHHQGGIPMARYAAEHAG